MDLLTPARLDIPGRPAKDAGLLDEWRNMGGQYASGDEERDGNGFWVEDAYQVKIAEKADEALLDTMAERFLRYRFYPERIISPLGRWEVESNRRMRDGDQILQRAHLLRVLGIDLIDLLAIVEVRDVIDEARKKGFSYFTTGRHPGVGIFHVSLSLDDADALWLHMDSISRPAFGALTRLPIAAHAHRAVMRFYQRRAHRAGIAKMKARVTELIERGGHDGHDGHDERPPRASERRAVIEEGRSPKGTSEDRPAFLGYGATAMLGLILWTAMMLGIPSETVDEIIVRYVLLGVLVMSPLALQLISNRPNAEPGSWLPLLAMTAGLGTLLGAFMETGIAAAGYFVIGAAWITLAFAGIDMGFGPTIARLTAVHFHFTGLGATTLAFMAWSRRGPPTSGRLGTLFALADKRGRPGGASFDRHRDLGAAQRRVGGRRPAMGRHPGAGHTATLRAGA